jgi:hypothetical protein
LLEAFDLDAAYVGAGLGVLWKLLDNLLPIEPLEDADVALPQFRHWVHNQVEAFCDNVRGLAGTRKGTAVEHLDAVETEAVGQQGALAQTEGAQRDVQVALDTALGVCFALGMSDDDKSGRHLGPYSDRHEKTPHGRQLCFSIGAIRA